MPEKQGMSYKELLLKTFLPRPNTQIIPQKETPIQENRTADTLIELAAQKTYTPEQERTQAQSQGKGVPTANAMSVGKWGKPGGNI
jgi:hypothetical protein